VDDARHAIGWLTLCRGTAAAEKNQCQVKGNDSVKASMFRDASDVKAPPRHGWNVRRRPCTGLCAAHRCGDE